MGKREPKIRDKKERGEWAEMVFMERAAERGIAVSRPWGTRSYDFVVGRPGRFLAVQVKCTIFELGKDGVDKGYMCSVCTSSRPYAQGSFDFLAAYLVYEDAWYIIPEAEMLGKKTVSLATNCVESRYEEFREAWHLLEEPRDDGGEKIEIQACADEEFESFESGLVQWTNSRPLTSRFYRTKKARFSHPIFFTSSKLLIIRAAHFCGQILSTLFLSHPQGTFTVHSFCTQPRAFSVARRNILPQSGFSET